MLSFITGSENIKKKVKQDRKKKGGEKDVFHQSTVLGALAYNNLTPKSKESNRSKKGGLVIRDNRKGRHNSNEESRNDNKNKRNKGGKREWRIKKKRYTWKYQFHT